MAVAKPKETAELSSSPYSLLVAVKAAMKEGPNLLMANWRITPPITIATCEKASGVPSCRSLFMTALLIFQSLGSILTAGMVPTIHRQ